MSCCDPRATKGRNNKTARGCLSPSPVFMMFHAFVDVCDIFFNLPLSQCLMVKGKSGDGIFRLSRSSRDMHPCRIDAGRDRRDRNKNIPSSNKPRKIFLIKNSLLNYSLVRQLSFIFHES